MNVDRVLRAARCRNWLEAVLLCSVEKGLTHSGQYKRLLALIKPVGHHLKLYILQMFREVRRLQLAAKVRVAIVAFWRIHF